MNPTEEKQQKIHFSLQEEVDMLRSSNRHYQEVNGVLLSEVARLTEQVADLKHQLFGSKTEKISQVFMPIPIAEPDGTKPADTPEQQEKPEAESAESAPRQKKAHKRKLLVRTDKLVEHIEIPEEVKQNPDAYRRLPESMDKVSIRLEHIPSHLEVHQYRRPCFEYLADGNTKGTKIICAPAPVSILPGSNMGASLLAYVLHSKFCLHMPFYRMINELDRMGLSGLDEATVCNWHKAVAEALRPIWQTLHRELLDSEVLHVDETPFRCLKSSKKHGYMWAVSDAESGANLYYWHTGRSADVLDSLLHEGMQKDGAPFNGTIVTDGYDAYESWVKKQEEQGTRPCWQNCWTHVRRKFVEAARCGNQPQWSRAIVEIIKPLYKLEKQLRESNASPEQIIKKRTEESRPIAEAFFKELERKAKDSEYPPLNKLKKAINYALERKETLMHWLDNPAVPMDNNQVERAIRPLTIGRKNSLFIGAPEAGERSAILYTMVEECKRVGVNPQEWLTEALRLLPTYRTSGGYLDLLPGNLLLHTQSASAPVRL